MPGYCDEKDPFLASPVGMTTLPPYAAGPPDYPQYPGYPGYPPPGAWQGGPGAPTGPPGGYDPPPGGAPPPGGWGYGYYPLPGWTGRPGRLRATGVSILLFVVTLGIYGFIYNYQVHSEMKAYSGRGVGGGVALLITFIAAVAMPFVTSAEVGSLYARRGQPEPVRGWTGLWAIVPAAVGYVLGFVATVATFSSLHVQPGANPNSPPTVTGTSIGAIFVVGFVIYFGATLTGGLVWFVKTNRALNAFWASLGVAA